MNQDFHCKGKDANIKKKNYSVEFELKVSV